jgi:glycosyltransferase involved in cell wall biosynthesis
VTAKPPAVSVVMTAYNVEPYIGSAIESALAQTFRDFELIVMDDGSSDGTLRVAERFQDSRMRVVRAAPQGPATQLRDGIWRCHGRYLALLDADGLWDPNKLARHVEFLDSHPAADLTFSWSRILDEKGRDTGLASPPWEGPISFSELLADNVIASASALVFRREALIDAGGIDTTLDACFDLDACLRIGALRNGNLWAIPELLSACRRRQGQSTADVEKLDRSFERLLQKARWFAPRATPLVEPVARSNMQRFCAYAWYRAGHYRKALATLVRSLRRDPRVFSADRRNWKISAAALSGLLLPGALHRRVTRAGPDVRDT